MKIRKRKCSICRAEYIPRNSCQPVCSVICAIEHVRLSKRKAVKRKTLEAKRKLKSRRDYLREAQAVFNRYIRLRDRDRPCISCGTTANVQYAAGHYRTVAAAGHLRFDERNVHKQCNKNCNGAKSGNIVEYRKGLIARIGVKEVEDLENDNSIVRWSIEDLKAIKAEYALKIRLIGVRHEIGIC